MRSFGHVVISVAIEFPLSSKGDALFLMLVGMVFVIICRVRIKHIALFVNYCNAKEISFIQSQQYKTLCKTQKKNTCEFHLYCWDHICKVNKWCLFDCFHCKFRIST